jgi:hypothetical protein
MRYTEFQKCISLSEMKRLCASIATEPDFAAAALPSSRRRRLVAAAKLLREIFKFRGGNPLPIKNEANFWAGLARPKAEKRGNDEKET